ncbi:hypothetical protein M3C31_01775 [Staphylococcus hominis]|uniref:hypothetical protein n=1 Tax=Staphylococcus hominis TaxID=1290 RepID=UPI0021A8AF48|nr:hypothetical protein [Staphylococcus hominis]MCT1482578.1 hypothetical protein [Staphylococcus hominis]
MGNKKISRPEQFKLQHKEERTIIDSRQLKKVSGSYEFTPNSNSTYKEVDEMSEYIERKEFEQYEKRIDEKFDNLNSKIDALPELFADKLEIALGKRAEDERKERKDDKKSIIGWSISGTSLIIAFLGILGKAFGWF